MKKTRSRFPAHTVPLFANKFFLIAVLCLFVMSTTATITVGYGLKSANQVAKHPVPSAMPDDSLALVPSTEPMGTPHIKPTSWPRPTPSPTPSSSPISNPTPSPQGRDPQTTTNPPTPTPTPQSSPSPSPSPTPSPPPGEEGPPVMEITYPSEGVTIVIGIGSDGPLCIVEEVRGGNTEGLQRKYSFNGQPWTDYSGMNQLCLNTQIGLNNIKTKYRNEAGDESVEYSRTFIVVL